MHAGELDELEKISVDAARRQPGLVVWPEVPAPFSFTEAKFGERAQRIEPDLPGLRVAPAKRRQEVARRAKPAPAALGDSAE